MVRVRALTNPQAQRAPAADDALPPLAVGAEADAVALDGVEHLAVEALADGDVLARAAAHAADDDDVAGLECVAGRQRPRVLVERDAEPRPDLRRRVRLAVGAGRPPRNGARATEIKIGLAPDELAAVDLARGDEPRAAYGRAAMLAEARRRLEK